mmetsp:Transcript_162221/g.394128  ORF Transcript_162221/g.394128 Transcript_162221/m.394128 type:complete len:310 (+) Transcript_162221:770-1699(+)
MRANARAQQPRNFCTYLGVEFQNFKREPDLDRRGLLFRGAERDLIVVPAEVNMRRFLTQRHSIRGVRGYGPRPTEFKGDVDDHLALVIETPREQYFEVRREFQFHHLSKPFRVVAEDVTKLFSQLRTLLHHQVAAFVPVLRRFCLESGEIDGYDEFQVFGELDRRDVLHVEFVYHRVLRHILVTAAEVCGDVDRGVAVAKILRDPLDLAEQVLFQFTQEGVVVFIVVNPERRPQARRKRVVVRVETEMRHEVVRKIAGKRGDSLYNAFLPALFISAGFRLVVYGFFNLTIRVENFTSGDLGIDFGPRLS